MTVYYAFLILKERHLGDVNEQLKMKVSLELSSVLILYSLYTSIGRAAYMIWEQKCQTSFALHLFQLQADGQDFRNLPCSWNTTTAPAGNTILALHPPQPNPMDCDNEQILQIGYSLSLDMFFALWKKPLK